MRGGWYNGRLLWTDFMEANKRRPSKFVDEERGLRNWWKHQQKLVNAGELKAERMEKLTIVDFRHDSTLFERVRHCAHCSESLENFWK